MNEQRPAAHERVPSNIDSGELPGVPGVRGDRVRARTDSEHVQNHELAVRVPAEGQEAPLWRPAMRKVRLTAMHHPRKVDTIIDGRGQLNDLRIAREVLARSQNPSQQYRRVDGRDLAAPAALACCRIHVVVKPAVFVWSAIGEKA